ncbi:hypothetical protein FGO68_gene14569 [Halteria grandinella]|uniref:Trafficking protein particle complex subunit n=1 Tax=Halteria grandinella TaxID=5974 RepID=A0A8J8NJ65_HALGN|nr:hypothetical protein FGO68_gene14569 [Halteria grandinella]
MSTPAPPTSSNVYEFLIYNKTGACLFHLDFTGTINFDKDSDKNSDVRQRQKLVYGLVCGIKSFSQMLSSKPLPCFRNYATAKYKFHIYELPTGLKLVLMTSPLKSDQFETLQKVFQTLYVPLISRNIFCTPNQKIQCKLFREKVGEFLIANV